MTGAISRLKAVSKHWPGVQRFDGLKCEKAELNSKGFSIDKTTATYTFAELKENDELVKLKYNISATFNGTVELGNASDPAAYIADAIFPKSGADVLLLHKLLTADASIILTVSGNTTGAGIFKLEWSL